jgi:hypothetical protein
MYILQFWKSWPNVYKRIWWIILIAFAGSLAFVASSLIRQPEPVYTWQQLQELKRQEIPIYNVEVGGNDLPVLTENYILFERWLGNPIHLNLQALDFYLIFFSIGLTVLLAIISVLPRFWFLAAAGATVFMISNFQLETLEIFNLENKIPTIITMMLFITIGLYYQFFRKAAQFFQRVLVFAAAMILLELVIANFSSATQPLRYFAINTLPSSIVLLLIFIILVAHEIMASFVSLVGKGTHNSKSQRHYMIISGFYLLNLWLAYLDRINYIEWAFTIPPFLLLIISGILAVWGIRQRQPQYEQIISADPFGVYMIVSLGIISFSVIGYFVASSSDVVLLSLNDLILYAHIGYGMIFFLYVISNFLPMLQSNLQVHRVLYKPTVMPYFSYRMAGLIFTLALLFFNTWMVPVNHFISGYYTSLGDLFESEGNSLLATGYYKRAYFYSTYNQHAATALAEGESSRNNLLKERTYRDGANSYRPTEYTLINGANTYAGNSLEEVVELQDAHQLLPKSGIIKNNLGLSYSKLGMIDSAYRLFSDASRNNLTKASAEMNLIGVMAINDAKVDPDSVYKMVRNDHSIVKSNVLAIANHQDRLMEIPVEFPKDSVLNLFSATFIGNYITNHINQPDTSFLSTCVLYMSKKENKAFSELVLVPAAKSFYAAGQVNRAFEILQSAIFSSSNPGPLNTTLAIWSLDQEKADVAMSYLKHSSFRSPQTSLVNAVAIAESGKIDEAISAWDTLSSKKDSVTRSISESMKRVLGGPASWYADFTDKEKYQYLRYRVSLGDSLQFNSLLAQIKSEDLKAKAILDRSKKWFSQDEIKKAALTYQRLQGLHMTDMSLFGAIKYYELRLFAAQGYWQLIDEQIKKGVLFGPYHETENIYYEALRSTASGDSLKAAKNFDWLATNNSYFDEGIVGAAGFFTHYGSNKRKPYLILSEALQVNPNSVKILKAYIPIALASDYDEYATSALQTLSKLISPSAFRKFVAEKQLSDLLLQ